jgi:hypothetical protein
MTTFLAWELVDGKYRLAEIDATAAGGGEGNLDGGTPDANFGGVIDPLDGGTP